MNNPEDRARWYREMKGYLTLAGEDNFLIQGTDRKGRQYAWGAFLAIEGEFTFPERKCHTCRTLQWDNRLIWSLEKLLAWVRENHMDQQDIRDHIDLMLGEYRNELEKRQRADVKEP